ncbi:MAG: hypothetical protein DSZ08_04705 [Sulfurovum sp.]|nr:MAG: hypothetical protein DSZ08_04705 [Sulfurovum sp.]
MPFFSRVFLPFLLLIYIAIETYLKLHHSSLCDATGCKLAGELLRFNPIYLNYLGLFFVSVLTLLGYASLKSNLAQRLFFMVLYASIAFETTIIGYQFIVNPEPCVFCLGIFSSLLLIALLARVKDFLFILSIVLAIFLALSTLAIPKNKTFMQNDGAYLIHSDSCPHCKKVKKYLSENHINYTPISVEEASARNVLKFMGIDSIPVLMVKDATEINVYRGDQAIISYYTQKSSSQKNTSSASLEHNSLNVNDTFLKAGAKSDGCALSIVETTPCEDNTSSHE